VISQYVNAKDLKRGVCSHSVAVKIVISKPRAKPKTLVEMLEEMLTKAY